MDEVDKIIIHSLKQIGCKLETDEENEIFGLNNFSPSVLVKAVSRCLQEIKPDVALPKSLPENMAQRFTVATTLAEVCSSCGYRGDIGYQTFLYPNVVDIRRLFMFLIEQLPKEQIDNLNNGGDTEDRNDYVLLMKEVKKKISKELKSPWVPQYCRGIANRKPLGSSSLTVEFLPQLNLNIPQSSEAESQMKEITYQVPNVFQQTSSGEYDLVSSVMHKCAIDLYISPQSLDGIHLTAGNKYSITINNTSLKPLENENIFEPEDTNEKISTLLTPLQCLTKEVESIKLTNDLCVKEGQTTNNVLTQLRQKRSNIEATMQELRKDIKIHERTCVILENPLENIGKLEGLIDKTRERRLAVENQWQLHREPALKQINELQKIRQSKNLQNINELRNSIQELENNLKAKTNHHAQLADEIKINAAGIANRKEYTRRIYEFIGNIRKQRNDIYKILDDTRDLQKQLNSVSAQNQRQFNYTDDLLFQSAKHDVHAKQAYKLLASLHVSCNEIGDMVARTGQMTKEIRDLEVQIDREQMRNVGETLLSITTDIKQFEIMIKSMQDEINQVENEIHCG